MVTKITGTPFKARSKKTSNLLNKRISELSAQVSSNKKDIIIRRIEDKIESRRLPSRPRPGTIE